MNNKDIKSNKKKKNKNKKKPIKKILLLLVLVLLIAGGVFAYKVHQNGGGTSGMLATVLNSKKDVGEIKVLLLGISTDQENVELTDTIIVASYNPNTQKATLLSIPRDTYTGKNTAKATAYEKINALYGRQHRPDETLKAVNEITGLNIEYYVVIKTEALIKLVDVIGGVTFNVPIDMDYDDTSQDLHIHLKAGEQKLDGNKAEQLVRFRHSNPDRYGRTTSYPVEYGDNDIGRMRTQREFILQVVKQTARPENIFKLGEILDVAKQYVLTNIDFNVAKDYIPYAVEFDTSNMLTETLPGTVPSLNKTNNVSIFVYDKQETKKLVQELFFDRDIQEDGNDESDENQVKDTSKANLEIEVLNGSGDSSILTKVVNTLKGAGFHVTRTGSTTTTSKTTIINKKNAKETLLTNIKDVLGKGSIETSEASSSKVDVTIIIGKDY